MLGRVGRVGTGWDPMGRVGTGFDGKSKFDNWYDNDIRE